MQKQDLRRRFVARARVHGLAQARLDYHISIVCGGKWWRQFKHSLPPDFPPSWAEVDPDLQEYAKSLAHANGYVSDEMRFQEEWREKREAVVTEGATISEQVVPAETAAISSVAEHVGSPTVDTTAETLLYNALMQMQRQLPMMDVAELNETVKTVGELVLASRVMSVPFAQAQRVLVEAQKRG